MRAGIQRSETFGVNSPLGSRHGKFQVYRNGAWATLKTVDFKASNGWSATVKTPLVNSTVTWRYRLTIDATAQEKAWTSSSTVVEHRSPVTTTRTSGRPPSTI